MHSFCRSKDVSHPLTGIRKHVKFLPSRNVDIDALPPKRNLHEEPTLPGSEDFRPRVGYGVCPSFDSHLDEEERTPGPQDGNGVGGKYLSCAFSENSPDQKTRVTVSPSLILYLRRDSATPKTVETPSGGSWKCETRREGRWFVRLDCWFLRLRNISLDVESPFVLTRAVTPPWYRNLKGKTPFPSKTSVFRLC